MSVWVEKQADSPVTGELIVRQVHEEMCPVFRRLQRRGRLR